MNNATAQPVETPKNGDVIDVSFIEEKLLELPPEIAWDMFQKMNTLLIECDAWVRNAGNISRALKEKMKQQELSNRRMMLLKNPIIKGPIYGISNNETVNLGGLGNE